MRLTVSNSTLEWKKYLFWFFELFSSFLPRNFGRFILNCQPDLFTATGSAIAEDGIAQFSGFNSFASVQTRTMPPSRSSMGTPAINAAAGWHGSEQGRTSHGKRLSSQHIGAVGRGKPAWRSRWREGRSLRRRTVSSWCLQVKICSQLCFHRSIVLFSLKFQPHGV